MSRRRRDPLLATLTACLSIAACGPGSDSPDRPPGQRLYLSLGCTGCHGQGGEGTFMGPPLRDLGAHWTREELARFVADPRAFDGQDERLRLLGVRYRMPMKPISASEAERLTVADHVLTFR